MHRKLIRVLNAPKFICNVAIGHDHKPAFRYAAGLVLMILGVCLSKAFAHNELLHIPSDLVGYGIHGMGLTPFIEIFHGDES